MSERTLVTGAAGFIGSHVTGRLVREPGRSVVGVDNFDPYYDPRLKRDRLAELVSDDWNHFYELDLAEPNALRALFAEYDIQNVIHLAARPGARASSEQPRATIRQNIDGFTSVLEACRHHDVDHLLFASSSSVYGRYRAEPLSEDQPVNHPVSLYAATKVSNEAMAHSYAHQYGLATTGLRFFTVYGPWGRPDMAYYQFADAIADGEPIELYNYGDMRRDFTYVDDIVDGIEHAVDSPPIGNDEWTADAPAPNPATSSAPYRLYNIGQGAPDDLETFVETLEQAMGQRADKRRVEMPASDVQSTCADATAFAEAFDYRPSTDLQTGLEAFVEWYRGYRASRTASRRAPSVAAE